MYLRAGEFRGPRAKIRDVSTLIGAQESLEMENEFRLSYYSVIFHIWNIL